MTKPNFNVPVEYVARPKPFTLPEHKQRRIEELRAAIENARADERAAVAKRVAAEEELGRLKG